MKSNLIERLNKINSEIDEIEFALRICDSRVNFVCDIKKNKPSQYITTDYDKQISIDAYNRMTMHDKLRKLMNESMDIQDKLCQYDD